MLRVYVEGNDKMLIQALLCHHLKLGNSEFEIDTLDGGLSSLVKLPQRLRENIDNGEKVIVILDSDNPPHAGFTKVYEELNSFKEEHSLEFDFFLLPNHNDDGNLEDLLESMINSSHEALFACFEGYVTCLNNNNVGHFHLPVKKTKIYAYVDTLTPVNQKKLIRNGNYQFDNGHYWDLGSEGLNNLIEFLNNQLEI